MLLHCICHTLVSLAMLGLQQKWTVDMACVGKGASCSQTGASQKEH